MTTLSVAATAVASASTVASVSSGSSASTSKLVKLANGEYTADSVSKDPSDAQKLGLVKQKDGNYGTSAPSVTSTGSAAASASSGVQSALLSLSLGGR